MLYREEIEIPFGNYESVNQIIAAIDRINSKSTRPIRFSYDSLSTRTWLAVPKNVHVHFQNSDIAVCLGFNQQNVLEGKETVFESDTVSSVDRKYVSIYC